MKKLKSLIIIFMLSVITFSGVLFGCGDKYKNMKVTTDLQDGAITLYYHSPNDVLTEEELKQKPSIKSFVASVTNAPKDAVLSLEYSFENTDIVSVKKTQNQNETTFSLTATNGGSTKMKLFTSEGGKSTTIDVNVVCEVESISFSAKYKPYVLADGKQTKFDTSTLISFSPGETTQKNVKYVMEGNYEGVTVNEDGTIIATNTAKNGKFKVYVESLDNKNIKSEPFEVSVLEPIKTITATYDDKEIDSLNFSTNRLTENYKVVNFSAEPNENEYTFVYSWIYADGTTHDISENQYFEFQNVGSNNKQVGLTAKFVSDIKLKVNVKLNGYEYISEPKIIDLHSEDTPIYVSVNNNKENANYYIYDSYANILGYCAEINVGEATAKDRRFVLSIENADKVEIYKEDKTSVKLYKADMTNGTFDILPTGTKLYIKCKELSAIATENVVKLDVIAFNTIGLIGDVVKNTMTLNLKSGAKELSLQNKTNADGYLYIPVAVDKSQTQDLNITIKSNEWTNFIYTKNTSDNAVLVSDKVYFDDSIYQNDVRIFNFKIYGVKEGIFDLIFYSENGITKKVSIRVYQQVDKVSITTSNIADNSDIGAVNYTQDNPRTLKDIVVRVGGKIKLSINKFFNYSGNLLSCICSAKSIMFEITAYDENGNEITNSANYFVATNDGYIYSKKFIANAKVSVSMQFFDGTNPDGYNIIQSSFKISSYTAISNISLDTSNLTLYAIETLPNYENYIKTFGEHIFTLNTYPNIDEKEFDANNIKINISCYYDNELIEKIASTNPYYVSFQKYNTEQDSIFVYFTVVMSQFGRTFATECVITIKKAPKISSLFNISKTQNGTKEYLTKQDIIFGGTNLSSVYYIYTDARQLSGNKLQFKIASDINPQSALIKDLFYSCKMFDGKDANVVMQISQDGTVSLTGVAGLCVVTISAIDSYSNGEFSVKTEIYIKIADGTTYLTALEISNASDFVSINNNAQSLQLFYVITKDIDLSSIGNWTPIGFLSESQQPVEFNGQIDGEIFKNGFRQYATISGLSIKTVAQNYDDIYYGLFAKLNGIIKNTKILVQSINLNLSETKQTSSKVYVGCVCGELTGNIENVKVNIVNSEADANIVVKSNEIYIGGICGTVGSQSKIFDCEISGNLSVQKMYENSEKIYMGGITGKNLGIIDGNTDFFNNKNVADNYNSAVSLSAYGKNTSNFNIVGSFGGIVGSNAGQVVNSSFDGQIKASQNVGGIAGINEGTVDHCYSSGRIYGTSDVGGLVGLSTGDISYSSVNMFDETTEKNTTYTPNITAKQGNVGGLVGQVEGKSSAEKVSISYSYVRSYIKDNQNFAGDLKLETSQANNYYLGGLVGSAQFANLSQCYSIVKIYEQSNFIGGLIGTANFVNIENCYERNIYIETNKQNVGSIFGQNAGDNNAEYFYSTNDVEFVAQNMQGVATSNISNCLKNDVNLKDITTYNAWTDGSGNSIISETDTSNIWYMPSGYYPFLTYNQNVLTVEAPTKINISLKNNVATNVITALQAEDNFVLWKNSSSSIVNLKSLFDISVLPDDSNLNVSNAIKIYSSDESIVSILGRTNNDYKFKLLKEGDVTLTFVSKLDKTITKIIKVFVRNSLVNFKLSENFGSVFVGGSYNIKYTYQNNTNFILKIDKINDFVSINGKSMLTEQQFLNVDPLYIASTKSGKYNVKITPYLVVNGENVNLLQIGNNFVTLEINFYYGIKNYTSSVNKVEMGLNSQINIVLTATGDNLKLIENSISTLPKFSIIKDKNYINISLTKAVFYTSLEGTGTDIDCYLDGDFNIVYENAVIPNDDIVKIEYMLEVTVNKSVVTEYFDMENNKDKNMLSVNLQTQFSIGDSNIIDEKYKNATKANTLSTFDISRQKLEKVGLEFYSSCEKYVNSEGNDVFSVNEVPTTAIIAGQIGMLKINLYPTNAEVKSVNIYYNLDARYNMSLNQVVKNTDTKDGKTVITYYDCKPYANSILDGRGLQLFADRSNVIFNSSDQSVKDYSYDGNLYVNFLIGGIVPEGQIFIITVEVNYVGGLTYAQTIQLQSQLKSKLEIAYKFNQQIVNDIAYIPENVEKEFYIDFTKIFSSNVAVSDLNDVKFVVNNDEYILGSTNKYFSINSFGIDEKQTNITTSRGLFKIIAQTINSEPTTYKIQAKISRTINNTQTTFTSNIFNFVCVPFVVNNIQIVETSSETKDVLTVKRGSPVALQVKLDVDMGKDEIDTIKSNNEIIVGIKAQIETILNYWYARKGGSVDYTKLDLNSTYTNFDIISSENQYLLQVKKIATGDKIYCKIVLNYDDLFGDLGLTKGVSVDNSETFVYQNMLKKIDSGKCVHYLTDEITLNLISDVSDDNSIPVQNNEEFLNMASGSAENGAINYSISVKKEGSNFVPTNIILENYTPFDLKYINFDGNGCTITIRSFAENYAGGKYGLFSNIDENSTVKNLTVKYEDIGIKPTDTTLSKKDNVIDCSTRTDLTEFDFGGVCAINNGVIYNCKVESNEKISFTNKFDGTISTFIGGLCAQNEGFITHSQSSISFTSNCGTIGGFVAVNTKKISTSKVVLSDGGTIENTLTTKLESLTGGFVARNNGTIFGSYIAGSGVLTNNRFLNATISSFSVVSGFVNNNNGTIKNCYSNIKVTSTTRSSGFAFVNSGTIESSYSASKMITNNTAHTPFVGTSDSGAVNNSGKIDDCYFLADNFGTVQNQIAVSVDSGTKSNFAKFVFTIGGDDGIWKENVDSLPTLVDADMNFVKYYYYNGISDGRYNWNPVNNELSYGKKSGNQINPATISNIDKFFVSPTTNDYSNIYAVLLCDIVSNNNIAPDSSKMQFSGKLFGQNMKISNLYLRANSDYKGNSFGLFASIVGSETDKAIVKDLILTPKEVVANNVAYVGTLAGFAINSILTNIEVVSETVVIQGKYMVGGLVGLVADSDVTKINVSVSVNASLSGDISKPIQNYLSTDLIDELGDSKFSFQAEKSFNKPYSYAGVFAGAMISVKNSNKNNEIENITTKCTDIKVTGNNKVIGFYTGTCVGLVAENCKLSFANVVVANNQYIRAFNFAGGLVAENRGFIDKCQIKNSDSVDLNIDLNNSYLDSRNTSYFSGSPKIIGGLVGFNNGGTITNSFSKLDVITQNESIYVAGGLVGLSVGGVIQYCYATGAVAAKFIIGGLIGAVSNNITLLGYTINNDATSTTTQNNTMFDHTNCREIKENGVVLSYTSDNVYISPNKLKITNCFASNSYINAKVNSYSNTELIELAVVKGLFVGAVLTNGDDKIVFNDMIESDNFKDNNNFVNTQITTKVTYTNDKFSDCKIPDAISAFGITSLNDVVSMTIGMYVTNFYGEGNTEISGQKNIANFNYINAIFSHYSLVNFDSLVIGDGKNTGIYQGFNNAYTIPNKSNNSQSYYPTLKYNINQ